LGGGEDGYACSRYVILRGNDTDRYCNFVIPFIQIESFKEKGTSLELVLKTGNTKIITGGKFADFVKDYLEYLM